jgi:hypothetical protein
MKNTIGTPAQRRRMVRWGVGITLAGFVAGGGFAAVAMAGSAAPTAAAPASASAQADNAELNALLSASSTTTSASTSPSATRPGRLRRLRGIGGYYGSITFGSKTGDRTVAFERGIIESITGSDVVVRAPDGVTMTWLLVSDTVVREKGAKQATSALSSGQLVFVGGPVVSGAKDARLIVIRTGGSAKAPGAPAQPATPVKPATPAPSSSGSASTGTSLS